MTRRRTEQALAVSRASVRTVRLGTSVVAIVLAEVGLRVALV
jgi:hypothetical protein